jgi:hypothetical protein
MIEMRERLSDAPGGVFINFFRRQSANIIGLKDARIHHNDPLWNKRRKLTMQAIFATLS